MSLIYPLNDLTPGIFPARSLVPSDEEKRGEEGIKGRRRRREEEK